MVHCITNKRGSKHYLHRKRAYSETCLVRLPVLKDHTFLAEWSHILLQMNLSPKTTCLEGPQLYGHGLLLVQYGLSKDRFYWTVNILYIHHIHKYPLMYIAGIFSTRCTHRCSQPIRRKSSEHPQLASEKL